MYSCVCGTGTSFSQEFLSTSVHHIRARAKTGQNFQPPPSSIPLKTVAEDPPMEDDSVFDSSTTVSVKTEPGISGIKTELHSNAGTPVGVATTKTRKKSSMSSSSRNLKHTAGTPLNDGEIPIITTMYVYNVEFKNARFFGEF